MNVSNWEVYGLRQSIIASGYPMDTNIDPNRFTTDKDTKRSKVLGSARSGSGHDNYLKGIIVQYDLEAPEYFWRQFDRYHFHDYVSSQSKMHRLTQFNVKNKCNKYVDERVLTILNEYINMYTQSKKPEDFQRVMANVPMGFQLTARITSNYQQEKTIYNQRKGHKLEEWRYYCEWLESLPKFKELIGG